MTRIERFEKIDSWKKSMKPSKIIYDEGNKKSFFTDFALHNRVRKFVIAIRSRIAEGFEKESNNQFINFQLIAHTFDGELRTQKYIDYNCEYNNEETKDDLINNIIEISKSLNVFISYLRFQKKSNKQLENNLLNL